MILIDTNIWAYYFYLAGVKRLYELVGEPKDLVVVDGADHNLSDPRAYEITMKTVVEWFAKKWSSHV